MGQSAIDAQHEGLVHCVAAMVFATSRDMQLLGAKRLYDLTREHFAYEEALMLSMRSPRLQEHGTQHKELLSRLDTAAHAIAEMRLESSDLGRRFSEWLLTHMTTLDVELVEEMRSFGLMAV